MKLRKRLIINFFLEVQKDASVTISAVEFVNWYNNKFNDDNIDLSDLEESYEVGYSEKKNSTHDHTYNLKNNNINWHFQKFSHYNKTLVYINSALEKKNLLLIANDFNILNDLIKCQKFSIDKFILDHQELLKIISYIIKLYIFSSNKELRTGIYCISIILISLFRFEFLKYEDEFFKLEIYACNNKYTSNEFLSLYISFLEKQNSSNDLIEFICDLKTFLSLNLFDELIYAIINLLKKRFINTTFLNAKIVFQSLYGIIDCYHDIFSNYKFNSVSYTLLEITKRFSEIINEFISNDSNIFFLQLTQDSANFLNLNIKNKYFTTETKNEFISLFNEKSKQNNVEEYIKELDLENINKNKIPTIFDNNDIFFNEITYIVSAKSKDLLDNSIFFLNNFKNVNVLFYSDKCIDFFDKYIQEKDTQWKTNLNLEKYFDKRNIIFQEDSLEDSNNLEYNVSKDLIKSDISRNLKTHLPISKIKKINKLEINVNRIFSMLYNYQSFYDTDILNIKICKSTYNKNPSKNKIEKVYLKKMLQKITENEEINNIDYTNRSQSDDNFLKLISQLLDEDSVNNYDKIESLEIIKSKFRSSNLKKGMHNVFLDKRFTSSFNIDGIEIVVTANVHLVIISELGLFLVDLNELTERDHMKNVLSKETLKNFERNDLTPSIILKSAAVYMNLKESNTLNDEANHYIYIYYPKIISKNISFFSSFEEIKIATIEVVDLSKMILGDFINKII